MPSIPRISLALALLAFAPGRLAAQQPPCTNGPLTNFLGKPCTKGDLVIALKDYDPGNAGPAAGDVTVTALATGLTLKFPTINTPADEFPFITLQCGLRFMSSNIGAATLMSDTATLKPRVKINAALSPTIDKDEHGLVVLDLLGPLMNITTGTLRTPTTVIKYSKIALNWEGPLQFAPTFTLTVASVKK